MSTQITPAANNAPAKAGSSPNIVAQVGNNVRQYLEKGTLFLPENYSPENALKSAWLTLQEGTALTSCTQPSIANALLDMVVQGLNPAKKQCYFISCGNKLVCQRSYFGDIALAERVNPGSEVYYSVVYDADDFEYDIHLGKKRITKHKQTPANIDPSKIIGAYCGMVNADGEDMGADYMPIDRIKKSWAMSKTYKEGQTTGPHGQFSEEMILRTVIRHRCKPIINGSNDQMLVDAMRRSQEDRTEAELDEQIALNGNGAVLAIEAPAPVVVAVVVEDGDIAPIGDDGAPY